MLHQIFSRLPPGACPFPRRFQRSGALAGASKEFEATLLGGPSSGADAVLCIHDGMTGLLGVKSEMVTDRLEREDVFILLVVHVGDRFFAKFTHRIVVFNGAQNNRAHQLVD